MLKYKFNLRNITNDYVEVEYKEIYLSPDGSYITGVTSPSYCLINETKVFIENTLNKGWQEYPIVAQNKTRCGFVKLNKRFYIEEDSKGQYIRYNDGKAYRIETDHADNQYVIVNDKKYDISLNSEYVLIETKYWCDDNVVTIDNVQYDVLENNTNIFLSYKNNDPDIYPYSGGSYNVYPYIILRNDSIEESNEYEKMLYVFDREPQFNEKVTHFKIQKNNDTLLKVEEIVIQNENIIFLYLKDGDYDFRNNTFINVKKNGENVKLNLLIKEFDNNMLTCICLDENYQEGVDDVVHEIFKNPFNFIFTLRKPLFDETNIVPWEYAVRDYKENPIRIFCNHSSLSLPLTLNNENSLNLHQNYVVRYDYFEKKIEERINQIVDMEKDVYYPSYKIEKNDKVFFHLCDEIQIDLHFRSRNLETWSINSDYNEIANGEISNTWNLFDYYRLNGETEKKWKEHYPLLILNNNLDYYPPSDLLYFLNFKNEDVFYQKQKISKSFLRLSFYDSKNPNSQNLLATSTVFMSENDLYNKYIENIKKENKFITVEKRTQTTFKNGIKEDLFDDKNILNNISVGTELLDNENTKTIIFDENKRLSCSFNIKNRYEAVESSEGFYLYLFKDLFNKTEEATIYLKIEFNHAGEGKTINFMNMWKNKLIDNKKTSEKMMINWGGTEINEYLKGYPLEELNEHLYIDIKLQYDSNNKRYCYYLPDWMVEHNKEKEIMKINLFEVKIKDETNE